MKNPAEFQTSDPVKKFRQNLEAAKKKIRPGFFESLGNLENLKDCSLPPPDQDTITLIKVFIG